LIRQGCVFFALVASLKKQACLPKTKTTRKNIMETSSEFNIVWNSFSKGIERYFRQKTKDEDLAKDLLQDTFLKIYLKRDSLADEQRLGAWVHRIAQNSLMDYYRKKEIKEPMEGKDFTLPVEPLAYNELLATLVKPFMQQLPEEYREALVLTDIEGLSQKELAERLGISYSGAKSRVQRARKKLKEQFEVCCKIVADRYGNVQDCVPRERKCSCN